MLGDLCKSIAVAMAECSKCRTAIRGETGVRCNGVCEKVYHCTNKCAGIDQYSAKILDAGGFVRFICDDCIQYIHNVDLVLKEIQDGVIRNRQSLIDYKDEFELSLLRNGNEIKTLLQAIEKRYDERFEKMDSVQKSCEKNMQEVAKLVQNVGQCENVNKEMCNTIEKSNEKLCNEITKVIKDTNVKTNKTYAQTVRESSVLPNPTKQVSMTKKVLQDANKKIPLIVKPKEKQDTDKTKEDLNRKVDPINLKITNIENRSNGTLLIRSENDEERDKIKNAIEDKMGENYEVRVANPIEMVVTITDISFKYTEEEIILKLMKQNPIMSENPIKLINMYETIRNNKTIYNIQIKVNGETYENILKQQRVNIGWERCRVFDGTSVRRCYKCKGYNHMAHECKNEETCSKCHGNHKTSECNNEQMIKCINCVRVNKKLNLGLDDNHLTNYKGCPVYQNKLSIKKKRLGLSE